MAEIAKYHRNPNDKIAAIARQEVADDLSRRYNISPPLRARDVYPIVLACMIIQALRNGGTTLLVDGDGNEIPPDPLPIAIVEANGYVAFETLVRGEYADSHLEGHEIREAYDIICREGRRPGEPLHFQTADANKMRMLHAIQKDYAADITGMIH
jgi:hypothetical protein